MGIQPTVVYTCDRCRTREEQTGDRGAQDYSHPWGWTKVTRISYRVVDSHGDASLCPTCTDALEAFMQKPPAASLPKRAPPGTVKPAVLAALSVDVGRRSGEVCDMTGLLGNSVRGTLSILQKDGKAVLKDGRYYLAHE